jgi:hypothetical protein
VPGLEITGNSLGAARRIVPINPVVRSGASAPGLLQRQGTETTIMMAAAAQPDIHATPLAHCHESRRHQRFLAPPNTPIIVGTCGGRLADLSLSGFCALLKDPVPCGTHAVDVAGIRFDCVVSRCGRQKGVYRVAGTVSAISPDALQRLRRFLIEAILISGSADERMAEAMIDWPSFI